MDPLKWLNSPIRPNPQEEGFWSDMKHRMAGLPVWQFAIQAPSVWLKTALTETRDKAYHKIYDALDHLYPPKD